MEAIEPNTTDAETRRQAVATFALTDTDEVVAAYEYCNLHGLWKC